MQKTVGVIQARMKSTRMPGKTLMDIAGKPLLRHVVERLGRTQSMDELVIATTDDDADKVILEFARDLGLQAIAGDREDVLSRYLLAAQVTGADVLVRVTGDCPLIDAQLSDQVIAARKRDQADYAGNFIVRSFPRGADTEAFTVESFEEVALCAKLAFEREHVTPYYYGHPEKFRLKSVEATGPLYWPDLRLCVDTPEDLELIREIYRRLGPTNEFTMQDVIALINREPALAQINAHVRQKPLV